MTRRGRRFAAGILASGAILAAARAEKPAPFVFAPARGAGPFPVAVWLHGYRGYSAKGYFPGATAAKMQAHADSLGAVIVGFPATVELGDGTERWSEDPDTDHAYVQGELRKVAKAANVDLSRVALFGFSEGGLVAAELATLYPESYLGAIVMSPGGTSAPKIAARRRPAHERQVYFCFCNAGENPSVVALTKALASHLRNVLGATVTLTIHPGFLHARPPDFMKRFPTWMGAILKGGRRRRDSAARIRTTPPAARERVSRTGAVRRRRIAASSMRAPAAPGRGSATAAGGT